jgi:outer membrane immunogenic protein
MFRHIMLVRYAIPLAAILWLVGSANAQSVPGRSEKFAPVEVTLAYSADRTNGIVGGCGCFWMSGGKAEVSAIFYRGFSVITELAGQHSPNLTGSGKQLSMVSYLFGPRYTWRNRSRLKPFAQSLIGGAHGFDALFPSLRYIPLNPDAFAFAAGGGIDIHVSRHFGLRAVQADYLQTRFPNDAGNREDHFRLAAGIIVRLTSER